jgi:hypothetical protein
VKLAWVAPGDTVTVDGTRATVVLLLESVTVTEAEGGAYFSLTVPVDEAGPTTLLGLNESAATPWAVPAGQTVSCALASTLLGSIEARIVALTNVVASARVVAVNEALVWFAGTVTLAGTVTSDALLTSNTWAPPAGAGRLKVTVPVDELPARTSFGFIATFDTSSGVARTMSVVVAGVSPGAPEVALIVTVVSFATKLAAWMFATPVLIVHAPGTEGWLFSMIAATSGWLLVKVARIPLAGANFASSTSPTAIFPGPITDGPTVTAFTAGASGSVPPGCSLTAKGTDTRKRPRPFVSM